jgi:hypothetical protein
VNKPRNAYPSTPYGTMQLNYFPGPQKPYRDDYFPWPRMKSKQRVTSSKSTSRDKPSDGPLVPTPLTSSLFAKRTENSARFRITDL